MEGKNTSNQITDMDNNAKTDDLHEKISSMVTANKFIDAHKYCDNILKTDAQNYKAWIEKMIISAAAFHNATLDRNSVENYMTGKSAWDTDGDFPTTKKIVYYADKALSCANDDEKKELLEVLYDFICGFTGTPFLRSMGSKLYIEYHTTILDFINANYDHIKQFEHFEKYINCLFDLVGSIYDFEADDLIFLLLYISTHTDEKLVDKFADDIMLHVNKLMIMRLRDKTETLSDIQTKIKNGALDYVDEYNEKKIELQKLHEQTATTAKIPDDLINKITELIDFNTDDIIFKKYVDNAQSAYNALQNCTDRNQYKSLYIRFINAKTELEEKYQTTHALSESLKDQAETLLSIGNNKKRTNGSSQLRINIIAVLVAILLLGIIVLLVYSS